MILVADLELMRSGAMAENRHMDNRKIIHQLKAITQELNVPVWYVGVGEGIDDLQPFVAKDFIEALF